jgi:hypothetical protein
MSTHHRFRPPFLLVRADGETMEFGFLAELAAAARGAGIVIVERHGHLDGLPTRGWIARDGQGWTIEHWRAMSALPCVVSHRFAHREVDKDHACRLGLPIPYLRSHRGHRGSLMRHPHHMSAERHFSGMHVEVRGLVGPERPRGRVHVPPDAWDDFCRASLHNRSWKRHRRTRWKETRCTQKGPQAEAGLASAEFHAETLPPRE